MVATPVYVINLVRRTDRRQQMARRLLNEPNVVFSSDVGCSYDGLDLESSALSSCRVFPWRNESDNRWWKRPLKVGEIGCTLSHMCCWEHARNDGVYWAVFLEDDVCFEFGLFDRVADLCAKLDQLDARWDLLYLGRERLEPDKVVFEEFSIPGFSYCTFAYVLSRAGIEKLVRSSLRLNIMPVDEYLPATYTKHPRDDVVRAVNIKLNAYGLQKDIVEELSEQVWGSDTEHSEYYSE